MLHIATTMYCVPVMLHHNENPFIALGTSVIFSIYSINFPKSLHFKIRRGILSIVQNKWGRSSAGRAFGSHPRGREFNPLRLHHNANKFVRVCMNSEGGDDRLFCLSGCCKLHKKSAAARFRRVRQRFLVLRISFRWLLSWSAVPRS